MASILVTGASGFIGRHLVNRLISDNYSVRILVRDKDDLEWYWGTDGSEVVVGDIRDEDSVARATKGVITVFHLAGKVHEVEGMDDTSEYEDVIKNGTLNIVTVAIRNGVQKFVFLSSLSVYGPNSGLMIIDESSPSFPVSPYGRAKVDAETLALNLGRSSGLHVCCLRPATVYGPGCKGNLARMIRMIDRGLFPPLPELGGRRSMVHVSDVVEAVLLAADRTEANGQCYNVTDGTSYSTREIYELICRGLGKRVPRWYIPIWVLRYLAHLGDLIGRLRGRRILFDSDVFEKLAGSAWFSSEKISRELGYCPTLSLEEALPELIAWYRKSQA